MATPVARKRLAREYANISKSPPEYIIAHPSEKDILEWHYILTGPPNTPYEGGQYWGTLKFPTEYPFAPPAVRMHTPSGRFRCHERLCLSISDYHPKSWNPAWEVGTILLGLLSFMTSRESTLGSVDHSEAERREFARRSRWWNSTGGGTTDRALGGTELPNKKHTVATVKGGDGGQKFKEEFPELDEENWKWLEREQIDPKTGNHIRPARQASCSPETAVLSREAASSSGLGAAVEGGQAARNAGQRWVQRNKMLLVGGGVFVVLIIASLIRGHDS